MRPGSCPICGMALEPLTVSLDEEENPELTDMTRRFWVAVVLTIPVFVLGMSDLIPGSAVAATDTDVDAGMGATDSRYACGAVGWLAILRACMAVDRESQSEHVHADRARRGSGLRVQRDRSARCPEYFPRRFAMHHGNVPVYFEAAAVIT